MLYTDYGYWRELIPDKFRNCIFPWGSRKETIKAVRYMEKLCSKMKKDGIKEHQILEIVMNNLPDRW